MVSVGFVFRKQDLSGSRMPIKFYMPITNLPISSSYVTEQCRTYPTSSLESNNLCRCVGLALFSSFSTGQCYPSSSRALTLKHVYPWGKVLRSCNGTLNSDPVVEPPTVNGKSPLRSRRRLSIDDNEDEEKRRKKGDHKNKGRVPWNKGIKHSEETRERIRRRTKEALADPKVRKKMSEAPRTLSIQTKVKIRASLRRLWGNRLKWKRSREKLLQSWAENIANAAKVGMSDEKELDWDSYDKLKEEIALLQIHQTAQKAKAKEMARLRAERAARAKSEKMAWIAQKRREREENARARGSIRKRNLRSKEERERLALFREEKLKERLMKIHKKKSAVNQVSHQHQRPWEKFDLDLAKGLRKEASLADQIRSAKNKRSEPLLDKL